MPNMEIHSAIVCDDIRREINNKEILIGVYTGDIIVADFPTMLTLSLWIEASTPEAGPIPVHMRVKIDNNIVGELKAMQALTAAGYFSLPLPQMQLLVEKPGSIVFEIEGEAGHWRTLKSKNVRKGPIVPPNVS